MYCFILFGDLIVLEWCVSVFVVFFFQAEDGIRDLVGSRGLGDVYKRQGLGNGVDIDVKAMTTDQQLHAYTVLQEPTKLVSFLSLIHI